MVPQWAQTLKGLNPPPSRAAKGLHKPHPPQPPTPGSRTCSLRFSMLTYFQFPSKHTVPLPELPPFHSLTYTLSLSPSLPPCSPLGKVTCPRHPPVPRLRGGGLLSYPLPQGCRGSLFPHDWSGCISLPFTSLVNAFSLRLGTKLEFPLSEINYM